MFNFLNKKKGEEERVDNRTNNPPKFAFPPPPNPQGFNKSPERSPEEFSKTPAFSEKNKENFGLNADVNLNQETEDGKVSFEIPDFAEEDIDNNINLNDETIQIKPGEKEEIKLEETEPEVDFTNEIEEQEQTEDQIEIDLGDNPDYQNSTPTEDAEPEIDFTKDETEEQEDEENELPAFEAEEESEENDYAKELSKDELSIEPAEEDLAAFQPDEEIHEETEDLPSFEVNKEEFPAFNANNVKPTNIPKFISKQEYKKIMISISNAKQQTEEMLIIQPQFSKTEQQLLKNFNEITKETNYYKDKLIEIDKKIFAQKG